MENKINIAELLKDCPKGMELDCAMYDNIQFDTVQYGNIYPIKINTPEGRISLSKYGCYSLNPQCKCVIFPKGKTTWEGFVPPCEFKDGDIVATSFGDWIGITTGGKSGEFMPTYCVIKSNSEFEAYFDRKETWQFYRLATTWEKAKLFRAIKANGYVWNEETKTLEKLIEPGFKIGNRIKSKINQYEYTIIDITKDSYIVRYKTDKFDYHVPFCDENKFDLVPDKFDVNTLKPFESRVLVRHNKDNKWCGSFFSHIDKDLHSNCYKFVTIAGKSYPMMIPYEGNEHLLSKTDDCDEYFKTWEK